MPKLRQRGVETVIVGFVEARFLTIAEIRLLESVVHRGSPPVLARGVHDRSCCSINNELLF